MSESKPATTVAALGPAVQNTQLHSLPLIARGKVRDLYAVGSDRMLMVASDRLSAFDVVMKAPVPGKGRLLTQMALFWFDQLRDIVPNHLTGRGARERGRARRGGQVAGPRDARQAPDAAALRSRGARLCRRLGLEGIPARAAPSAASRCRRAWR